MGSCRPVELSMDSHHVEKVLLGPIALSEGASGMNRIREILMFTGKHSDLDERSTRDLTGHPPPRGESVPT